MTLTMGSTCKLKSSGPRMEPCGTPQLTIMWLEENVPSKAYNLLPEKQDLNLFKTGPNKPPTCEAYEFKFLDPVSNAALMPKSNRTDN